MATKYRGMQVAPFASEEDVVALAELGANIIRYQINGSLTGVGPGIQDYLEWLDPQLDQLDLVLQNANIRAIIAIMRPPEDLDLLSSVWLYIALRYQRNSLVYGYDILNEPKGTASATKTLMNRCVNVIRSVDTEKRILISCPHSNPSNFKYTAFQKGDSKCLYVLHMYSPLKFTHQGVYPQYPAGIKYPTKTFNKAWLVKTLKPVRDWQVKHRAKIFMNEFSVSDGAACDWRMDYCEDLISIAQKYGWHWCFHAWREAPVWTPESCPPLMDLLEREFAKNQL